MTRERSDKIEEAATLWHIRLRDAEDDDWTMFEAWLAADKDHARAFQSVEDLDQAIAPLLPDVVFHAAANDAMDDGLDGDGMDDEGAGGGRRRWWLIGGGALAASIAAAVIMSPMLSRADLYEVATQAGEHQIVTLDTATRITLNGDTRMTFDRGNPRFARLDHGEALFHVRHDEARPFRLEVGDRIVEDAGTTFNVLREPGAIRVAVAEGRVIYNPGRAQAVLDAGSALTEHEDRNAIELSTTPVASVGAWQRGRLIYRGEPLSQVAADMARSFGYPIRVAPAIAARPVHGTIMLDGDAQALRTRIAAALDVDVAIDGAGWVIGPVGGKAR